MAQSCGLIEVAHGVQLWHGIFGQPLKSTLEAGKSPLVFMHGGVSHSGYHGFQISQFASTHTIIVYDLRGHGRSPMGPDEKLTYDALSEDLHGLLNFYSIPRATLIAWSEGCVVSWAFLAQHPDREERAFMYSAVDDYRKTDAERVSKIQGVQDHFARMEQEWKNLNPNGDYEKFIGTYVDMWMREPSWDAGTFRNVPVRGESRAAPIIWVVTADHDDWIPLRHIVGSTSIFAIRVSWRCRGLGTWLSCRHRSCTIRSWKRSWKMVGMKVQLRLGHDCESRYNSIFCSRCPWVPQS